MSTLTCLHPTCDKQMSRGRFACQRHFFALDDDLRRRLRASRSDSERGAIIVEARDYLESRMIGEHDIVTCRGADCGADVVWLQGFRRDGSSFRMIVDAGSVSADDIDFDRTKHRVHWDTCPNADDLRKRK